MPKTPAKRLSAEQVERALHGARDAFRRSDFIAGSPTHASGDFEALGLISHEEQSAAIGRALDEISQADYKGPHPPNHISGEPKCKGDRMLQFVWQSACFAGKRMYLKFCIKYDRFILLRIHEAWNPNDYEG